MSASFSTERPHRSSTERRTVLALMAVGLLAACGKKGSLRLPKPGDPGYEAQPPTQPKAKTKPEPEAQPEAQPKAQP